jgi:O-antigen/teichoic acid export membrane protein
MLQNAGGRVVSFFCQLVIAAILSPSDFGVIGLAFTVSSVAALLGNFGLDTVLLQRHKTMRLWIVPTFWFSFVLGLLALLVVLALGPIAARIYHLPAVVPLAAIIAIGMPLSGLGTLPYALMRSRLQFRLLAAIGFADLMLIQTLTIAFALAGFGAYSFALPLPIVATLRTAAVWALARPDLSGLFRNIGRIRYLMNSSLAVFATAVLQCAIGQGDYVLLGVMGSEVSVGVYFFAFKMASQPLLLLASSLSNVLFPVLSRLRNSPEAQASAAFRASKLLGLLIMPVAFLQAALIAPAIHVFFASKWNASIPPMQILSVGLGFDAIAWVASTLVTASRGFWRQFYFTLGLAPAFFILATIGGWSGSPTSMAIAVAGYYTVCTPAYTCIIFRSGGVPIGNTVRLYLVPAILSTISIGAALWLTDRMALRSDILQIAVISCLGMGSYAALLRICDVAGFKELEGFVRQILGSRVRQVAAA